MTKPNTVPNTVNSWFEILRSVVVNFPTAETTKESVNRTREWVCILTQRNEGEEENLRPDVVDDGSLEFLPRERALEERIFGHHDARTRCWDVGV